jgi:flagellar motor switch protein FliG
MPRERTGNVMRELACGYYSPAGGLYRFELEAHEKFNELFRGQSAGRFLLQKQDLGAGILRRLPAECKDGIIEDLEDNDPELAEEIKRKMPLYNIIRRRKQRQI